MRIPTYNTTATVYTGYADTPAGQLIYTALQCEVYETSISKRGGEFAPEGLGFWTLLTPNMSRPRDGNDAIHDIWYPGFAYNVRNVAGMDISQQFLVRGSGVRWLNQAGQHSRWYLVPVPSITGNPQPPQAPSNVGGLVTTFSCYRPFGAAAPVFANAACVFFPDIPGGRGSYSGGNYAVWDGYLECSSSLDIRDGLSRGSGLDVVQYADGDEVRIPGAAPQSRYVVVRVVKYTDPFNVVRKRVYVLRDQPTWPGP